MTFQLDLRFFHLFLLLLRSHAGSLAQRCHQTKEPGPESSERERKRHGRREGERDRERTPGTTVAAVWFDIQGWLIYGAGDSVSLLWVLNRTGQTGLLAASSPPTLLVTSFYHCTFTVRPSPARLSQSLNSDIVVSEVGKHKVISLSAVRITSRRRTFVFRRFVHP